MKCRSRTVRFWPLDHFWSREKSSPIAVALVGGRIPLINFVISSSVLFCLPFMCLLFTIFFSINPLCMKSLNYIFFVFHTFSLPFSLSKIVWGLQQCSPDHSYLDCRDSTGKLLTFFFFFFLVWGVLDLRWQNSLISIFLFLHSTELRALLVRFRRVGEVSKKKKEKPAMMNVFFWFCMVHSIALHRRADATHIAKTSSSCKCWFWSSR